MSSVLSFLGKTTRQPHVDLSSPHARQVIISSVLKVITALSDELF
jgi:hypothetical protein